MKNDFFKLSSKRILFSTMMASALLAVSPQSVFADVNEVQSVMQTGTVKGQVVDANGEPIIGASVLVKGTTNFGICCITVFNRVYRLVGPRTDVTSNYSCIF